MAMAIFGTILFAAKGEAKLMVALAILALVIAIHAIRGLFRLITWLATPAEPAPAHAYDGGRFHDLDTRPYGGRS
jgi:hypothetical protein